MPIQLRKEKMKPCNIRFRKSAIVMLGICVIFSVLFGTLVNKVFTGDKIPVIVVFCAFCLYFLSCVLTAVLGIMAYIKEDNVSALVQGIVTAAPAIFCILNGKTAIMMILAVMGKENLATKMLGDKTYVQYISTQYSYWVCMFIGLALSMVVGILAVVVFMKNGRQSQPQKTKQKKSK